MIVASAPNGLHFTPRDGHDPSGDARLHNKIQAFKQLLDTNWMISQTETGSMRHLQCQNMEIFFHIVHYKPPRRIKDQMEMRKIIAKQIVVKQTTDQGMYKCLGLHRMLVQVFINVVQTSTYMGREFWSRRSSETSNCMKLVKKTTDPYLAPNESRQSCLQLRKTKDFVSCRLFHAQFVNHSGFTCCTLHGQLYPVPWWCDITLYPGRK